MKYILIFLFALLCSVGYAQNPVSQYLGAPTTLVISRGALKADSSLILPQFPDTIAANRSPYIKFYPGNLIRVFNDIYMRNTTATKWELINGGGTGGNNFIDSLRKVGDSVFARKYGIFVYQYTDSAQNILANNGLSFLGDTLQLGGSLIQNTTITGTQKELKLDSIDFEIRDDSLFRRFYVTNNDINTGQKENYLGVLYSRDINLDPVPRHEIWISQTPGGNLIAAQGLSQGANSFIRVDTGIIKIQVPDANFQIDGIVPPPIGGLIRPLVLDVNTDKVYQWDSAYNWNLDTTSLSNRINQKIDSLYKSGDSVYARKNGVFVFQYIDSAQNLQKVTDAGNITTNNIIINDGLNGETGIDLYDGANASYVQIRTIDGGIKFTNTYSSSDFAHIYGNNQGRTQLKLGINSLGTTGVIKNNFITSSKNYELPNNSGTFALSVNNNYADSLGNITIPTIDTNSLRRVKYVGLTMPSAFNVTGSPITDSGTIAVTGAGTASQYVRGDGVLASFPTATTGGGASVSYYLNGSVNKGTFGGETYYEMSRTAIIGAGTDFTRTNAQGDGVVAQFITDTITNLLIPAGNWNLELYFSASSGGGTPSFYVELYKYDGANFTLISSNSTNPELIAFGTTINPYFCALAVPETILSGTDRLAIRVFVNTSGRSITLHTENSHLCQVITTFTTGLTAINGLTKQVQYFATGTSGTDFNISSSNDTHTFNLPTASATNRGALSSTDWSTFNNKLNPSDTISLSNRINTKLNISDTSAMLSPYLRSIDTTNKYVTSVFRKTASDSVFFVRGGSNNFAFRDSSGGGNIYNTDGTLTGNRTVTNNAKSLKFLGGLNTFARQEEALILETSTTGKDVSLIFNNTNISTPRKWEFTSVTDGTFSFNNRTSGTENLNFNGTRATFAGDLLANTNSYVLGAQASYHALWFNIAYASRSSSNYSVASNGAYTVFNAPTSDIFFAKGNSTRGRIFNTTGNWLIETAGTETDVPSALLQISSTTKGFLQPRLTTTQMNAISTPATGLSVFNTTDSLPYVYRGTSSGWQKNVTYTRTNDIGLLNGADQRLMIEPTTNIIAGRALTVEAGSTQAGGNSAFNALSQTSRNWVGMASTSAGDIYAVVQNGDIYKRTAGTGNFIALSQTTRSWSYIAVAPNGDVFATVDGGDIYKQTGGAGNFVALGGTSRSWRGIGVAPNGDIYAAVFSGDIYKSTDNGVTFNALGITARTYQGLTVAPNGDIYVGTNGGDIFISTNGGTSFTALGQGSSDWRALTASSNGDIYVAVFGGGIGKRTGGTGNFISLGQTSRNWRGMTAAPNGDVYASVGSGDIYIQTAGTANLNGGTLVLQSGVGKGTGTSTINFNTGTTLASGATLQTASTKMTILGNGNVGIGTTSPSAKLELSDTARGFLQTRMTTTQRNNIASPSVGLQVFTTTDSSQYVYRGTGAGWQQIANEIVNTGTLDFPSTNAQNSSDLTISLTGAVDGDAVVLGVPNAAVNANSCYTAWVSASNQITVRFNNYSSGAIDPASATFRVTIIK